MRRGVTLTELLFVVAILGVLLVLALGVYSGATSQAQTYRTEAIITKIDQLVTEKWEGYRTRAVPIRVPPGTDPRTASRFRLYALRELQRCEMPDRKSDVMDDPVYIASPSLQKQYRRKALPSWTTEHEGAECLYLILSAMRDGEDSALSWFSPSEISDPPKDMNNDGVLEFEDFDQDGMREVLDGAGNPVEFLRWAPGYVQEGGPVTPQVKDIPDYFDPLKADPRASDADTSFNPYALKPLVFSPGVDKEYGINTDPLPGGNPLRYGATTPPNDPYLGWDGSSVLIGTPTGPEASDNITNHRLVP